MLLYMVVFWEEDQQYSVVKSTDIADGTLGKAPKKTQLLGKTLPIYWKKTPLLAQILYVGM
jgi:hypothetical protein